VIKHVLGLLFNHTFLNRAEQLYSGIIKTSSGFIPSNLVFYSIQQLWKLASLLVILCSRKTPKNKLGANLEKHNWTVQRATIRMPKFNYPTLNLSQRQKQILTQGAVLFQGGVFCCNMLP
jgi:hypothetical protein